MWAPADLFSHVLNIFLMPLKDLASYFYQHLMMLALALLCIAALITILTMIGNRRARRS